MVHMILDQLSFHAAGMQRERDIKELWVLMTIESPDRTEQKFDGTVHYIRAMKENGGRYVRVIINPALHPPLVITMFFDRKLGRLV